MEHFCCSHIDQFEETIQTRDGSFQKVTEFNLRYSTLHAQFCAAIESHLESVLKGEGFKVRFIPLLLVLSFIHTSQKILLRDFRISYPSLGKASISSGNAKPVHTATK
jgi:hypothetical protein